MLFIPRENRLRQVGMIWKEALKNYCFEKDIFFLFKIKMFRIGIGKLLEFSDILSVRRLTRRYTWLVVPPVRPAATPSHSSTLHAPKITTKRFSLPPALKPTPRRNSTPFRPSMQSGFPFQENVERILSSQGGFKIYSTPNLGDNNLVGS